MSNVLVYAEHAHGKLPKATAVAVTAGKKLAAIGGGQTILAVLGSDIGKVAALAADLGADKVVTVDNAAVEHALADVTALTLQAVAESGRVIGLPPHKGDGRDNPYPE